MSESNTQAILQDAIQIFKHSLEKSPAQAITLETGRVGYIGQGIARVSGLPGIQLDELIRFQGGVLGTAFNLDEDEVGVVLLGKDTGIQAGSEVRRTGRLLDVPVGSELLGRVITPTGSPLDGRGGLLNLTRLPVEREATPIMKRAPVVVPLQTGIKAVDALVPIGRGQRELILGDRQTGKTAIALDTIINQREQNVICVYCAIGQRNSAVAQFVADLERHDALDYSIVVVANAEETPGLQFIAPYAATTIGEYFMEQGRDVLVIYDDLTRHAWAYREMSLLLRRPPGREAYPGDIFYIHSRLLERSTRLRESLGGGSLTALPIAETEAPLVVRAVLFTSPICTFCRQIVDKDLLPVIQEFGSQLQIVYVDVNTTEGENLYDAALEAFDMPRGVPLLFIDQTTLGGINITPQLPALVETYLAQGGMDWPAIPGLDEYLTLTQEIATPLTSLPEANSNELSQTTEGEPVVRAVMFWMDGCPHCEEVIQYVLPPLYEKHGAQFELFMIEVANTQDVDTLYSVAASYNISKEQTGVPFLIIGDQVLIGSDEVGNRLSGLVDDYLTQGGVDWPSNAALTDLLPATSPAVNETPILADTSHGASAPMRDNGFALAIVIMVGMGIALLYSIGAFVFGKSFNLPDQVEWLIPVFIVVGIAVASYLSYVETQSVEAICGPVGDCNTVQQSRFAKLFDILPVGVLGLMGYIALLASWLTRRFSPKLEKPAAIGFFGMAFFAVIFSLYLTYLEPFVIRAVCIWCLTSAVIVTILLLLGTPPAVRQYTLADKDE